MTLRMSVSPKKFVVDTLAPSLARNKEITSSHPNSVHRAFSAVLVTAQCFGIMPVLGITGHNATRLRFRWLNVRILYTCIAWCCACVVTVCSCCRLKVTGMTISSFTVVVFFGMYCVKLMLFLQLAVQWPTLGVKIHQLELAMNKNYGYPKYSAIKIKFITGVFLTISFAEHLAAKVPRLRSAILCPATSSAWLQHFFSSHYNYVFETLDYSHPLAALVLLVDLMATFSWNYIDIFLIMFSVVLTDRFKQVNSRLEAVRDKMTPVRFWREMREEYNRLSCVVRLIDAHVNRILFLSFGSNLYFICLQLLNSTKTRLSVDETVYFYLSFSYLLLRTLTVSLTAAGINEESKKPRSILFTVRVDSYNVEVQRMLSQVLTDEVALSGLNFFYVTRKLLLTLAGTIVTYEIVLLQMNGGSKGDLDISNNATSEEIMCSIGPIT